jgi:hypothetical protein
MNLVASRAGTTTTINAPAERVRSILVDFPRYPEWNPFIGSISGNVRAGESLVVRIQPPARADVSSTGSGRETEPGANAGSAISSSELVRRGASFTITPTSDERSVSFRQTERFRGLLVPFVGSALTSTQAGFEAMNAALKRRAEENAS